MIHESRCPRVESGKYIPEEGLTPISVDDIDGLVVQDDYTIGTVDFVVEHRARTASAGFSRTAARACSAPDVSLADQGTMWEAFQQNGTPSRRRPDSMHGAEAPTTSSRSGSLCRPTPRSSTSLRRRQSTSGSSARARSSGAMTTGTPYHPDFPGAAMPEPDGGGDQAPVRHAVASGMSTCGGIS